MPDEKEKPSKRAGGFLEWLSERLETQHLILLSLKGFFLPRMYNRMV
jgi:hypothetical protein